MVRYDQDQSSVPITLSNTSSSTVVIPPNAVVCQLQICHQVNTEVLDSQGNQQVSGTYMDKIDLTNCKISTEQVNQVRNFLEKWPDVFSHNDHDIGLTSMVKHHINLEDERPFKQRHRQIPGSMYDEVKQHLQELLEAKVIQKSHSPWASNIVLVRKKDKSLRLCVDYRQLNQRTIKDAYALPRIEEVLDGLAGSAYFSVLDMKSGYHQVEIAEEHKQRTAFTVGPLGFFEYNRLPFGLSNAPATYQRLMEDCLGELNHRICQIYLDDIIIFFLNFFILFFYLFFLFFLFFNGTL